MDESLESPYHRVSDLSKDNQVDNIIDKDN